MTELRDWLSDRRHDVDRRVAERGLLHTVTVARHQLARAVRLVIPDHVSGRLLEAGSGRSPYRSLLDQFADEVVTLDSNPEWGPDVVADVEQMAVVESESFDVVLSTQVLEHVRRPHAAMEEFARVLRPGGTLILSVPHLSMLHEIPHDYYRFTEYALQELCKDVGLSPQEVRPIGGWVSLLAHAGQAGVLAIAAGVPGAFWPLWALNRMVMTPLFLLLDRVLGLRSFMPRDVLVVAIKNP